MGVELNSKSDPTLIMNALQKGLAHTSINPIDCTIICSIFKDRAPLQTTLVDTIVQASNKQRDQLWRVYHQSVSSKIDRIADVIFLEPQVAMNELHQLKKEIAVEGGPKEDVVLCSELITVCEVVTAAAELDIRNKNKAVSSSIFNELTSVLIKTYMIDKNASIIEPQVDDFLKECPTYLKFTKALEQSQERKPDFVKEWFFKIFAF